MPNIKNCKNRRRTYVEASPSPSDRDDYESSRHSCGVNDQAPIESENDSLTRSPSRTVSQNDAELVPHDIAGAQAADRIGFLGFDFGTTTTGIAYANAKSDGPAVKPVDVRCVTGWSNAARPDWEIYNNTRYIPSEFTYPSTPQQMIRPKELEVKLDIDKLKSGAMESNPVPSTGKISVQQERFTYGWESRSEMGTAYRHLQSNTISLLKLRLLPDRETRSLTKNLEAVIRHLKDIRTLPDVEDAADEQFVNEQMLQDFFLPVFRQTKAHLQSEHWYQEDMQFYITMTWPPMCSDESREVLERACRNVESVVRISRQPSFEFAAEPEAAKDFVLASMRYDVSRGESFVVLDCGGGTVDAHTFTNRNNAHKSAGIRTAGKCCGARFVKETARRMLVKELKRRNWEKINKALEDLGSSIEEQIGAAADLFETNLQTCFSGVETWRPKILGMSEPPIVFDANDVSTCFRRSLEGTVEVMHDQLEQARNVGLTVRKIIMTGGFGQSPALQKRLQEELRRLQRDFGDSIDLVFLDTHEPNSENTVACGAVLRASNAHVRRHFQKMNHTDIDQDPNERIARYSYGVLRREMYQPGRYVGHRKFPKQYLKDFKSDVNGRIELQTILWLKQKGDIMTPGVFAELECAHELDPSSTFVCEEKFYASDEVMTSHFDEDSKENRAARPVLNGLEVNLSFLKDQGLRLETQGRPKPAYVIFPKVNGTTIAMPNPFPRLLVEFGLAAHFYEREIHPEQDIRLDREIAAEPEQGVHPELSMPPGREIHDRNMDNQNSETPPSSGVTRERTGSALLGRTGGSMARCAKRTGPRSISSRGKRKRFGA